MVVEGLTGPQRNGIEFDSLVSNLDFVFDLKARKIFEFRRKLLRFSKMAEENGRSLLCFLEIFNFNDKMSSENGNEQWRYEYG